MASTYTNSVRTEEELASTCQEMMPSRSLFSCCFDWVSPFLSWRSMESNSMASTSGTTGCIPENEAVMGSFHKLAPAASAMVGSSTLIHKTSYDVFINHYGPDVKTLASRIYDILYIMKVTAFQDSEELEYGDFLPAAIEAAIRGGTLHIAIFSEGYAESARCLTELSCMLKSGAKIVPVFYHVELADLRYVAQGKGRYAAAFERHEKTGRYEPERLQEWKDSLDRVCFYAGEIIINNYDEMRLLKNIVNIVLKEKGIRNVPFGGLNEMVEDFENRLKFVQGEGEQGVQIVGIWGMGVSGKTTLAKELYNRRSSFVGRSCFIFDIREAKNLLQNKQIQLLKSLGVNEPVDNVEQGKTILARHLRSFRVLIVIDDVDDVDQLDALLPTKDSLGSGSLIIVTTRNCEVLLSWGIHFIYKMRALDPFNAEKLFCWHAFLQPSPLPEFEKLVEEFLDACNRLPLFLKVYGDQLYGNYSIPYWNSMLHKLRRILPEDIKMKLRIGFDTLDYEERGAFLDVACFFIGERSSLATCIWDASGWRGLFIWESLLNKGFVEVDDNNCIRMQDHLKDLGREIANQHQPHRFWLTQQIIYFDKKIKETKIYGIRGIKATPTGIEERLSYREELAEKTLLLAPYLAELKLLVIEGDYFNQVIGEASSELLWLRWSNIGHRNLPAPLQNLRVLELSRSHHLKELWEAESDAPVQLREMIISECYELQRFPSSIGCLNELKKIVIRACSNIDSLPEEFCHLQLLEHLELFDCRMLSSLPSSFGHLSNLHYVDLSCCRNLRGLPISFKNLTLLQSLNLQGCEKLMLMADDFKNITKLEFLNLSGCAQLEELPGDITNQSSLRELYLDGVKRLRELPIKIGQLRRLQKMKIGSDLLISLPNSLGDLSSLTYLSIHDCPSLKSLPTSLGNLSLNYLSIKNCPKLESLPTSLENFYSFAYFFIEQPEADGTAGNRNVQYFNF